MFPLEYFRVPIEKFVEILDANRISFHLTGGATATAYGEPRMTQDVDFVIDPSRTEVVLDRFIADLKNSDFQFDRSSIKSAVHSGGMFQLLDCIEILKLDVYPRELIPGELSRSRSYELFEDFTIPIVSIVDSAASKLIWIGKGSHKSRRDVRAIVRKLDSQQRTELNQLATRLQLTELLAEVLSEPDEIQ